MLYKVISNGYIMGVAVAPVGVGQEISQEEYDSLTEILRSMPTKEGYRYRLKIDLTWEAVADYEEDISDAEALDILLGGDTE